MINVHRDLLDILVEMMITGGEDAILPCIRCHNCHQLKGVRDGESYN